MRLQLIPAAARTGTYVIGEDSVCLRLIAPALPVFHDRRPTPRAGAGSRFGELVALRWDDIDIGCRVHHKAVRPDQSRSRPPGRHHPGELIIGSSRVARRSP